MRKRTIAAIGASVAGALVATGVLFAQLISHSSTPDLIPIGGPFELVDQEGRTVTDKTFPGRPSAIFFGYTSCPISARLRLWNFLTGSRRSARGPTDSTSCSFPLTRSGIHQRIFGSFFRRSILAYVA